MRRTSMRLHACTCRRRAREPLPPARVPPTPTWPPQADEQMNFSVAISVMLIQRKWKTRMRAARTKRKKQWRASRRDGPSYVQVGTVGAEGANQLQHYMSFHANSISQFIEMHLFCAWSFAPQPWIGGWLGARGGVQVEVLVLEAAGTGDTGVVVGGGGIRMDQVGTCRPRS